MKAIRGAITVKENKKEEIIKATYFLMEEIKNLNKLDKDDIVSIITTATKDLDSSYPGDGIRLSGFDVPIICLQEQYVKDSLKKCIRLLIHIKDDRKISNVYVGEARRLRPDIYGDEL